jgi:stage II sporulation protein D
MPQQGAPDLVRAKRYVLGLVLVSLACARRPPTSANPPTPPVSSAADARFIRVSLGTATTATITSTSAWRLTDRDGRVVARGDSGERASVSATNAAIRLDRGPETSASFASPLSLVSDDGAGTVVINGRRYRGRLSFAATDSGVQVVNRVQLEEYLRGVVPRELGTRSAGDRAALEAQAVAARSYAITRLAAATRAYDLTATTSDQVYGGVDAENAVADAAVSATEGLVLFYEGRVVSAPYHSTCGGSTAEPAEVWRSRSEPFLQRVSDRIPGGDRYYCDIAPRFRWERSWRGDTLTAIVERYLRAYAQVPPGSVGDVRDITVEGRTASGRVSAVVLQTTRGRFRLQANDIRYVLRTPGGELLNSTYFSPEVLASPDGRLSRLTIRGLGYGHGVGMCQWGAIGRARAGQDFRTILRTYFPGTSVARAY